MVTESSERESSRSLDFEAFFQAEYDRLFRALFALTASAVEADDLAQEAFLRAYEQWTESRPRTLLLRICSPLPST